VAFCDSVRQLAVGEFPNQPEQKELQLKAEAGPETVPDEMPDHIPLVTSQTMPIAQTKTNISKVMFSHSYLSVCPAPGFVAFVERFFFLAGNELR